MWANKNHEHIGHSSEDVQDLFGFKWEEEPRAKPGVCALSPESIYGPFWKNEHLERQDIRDGQEGVYMRLAVQVIDVSTCKPMNNAAVEIWHVSHFELTVAPQNIQLTSCRPMQTVITVRKLLVSFAVGR